MAWPKGKARPKGAAKAAPFVVPAEVEPAPAIEDTTPVTEPTPEVATPAAPDMLEIKIVRGYWPIYSPNGERHGKLLPGDVVKLPTKEAKGIIRKGIAEFPPEEDDVDE